MHDGKPMKLWDVHCPGEHGEDPLEFDEVRANDACEAVEVWAADFDSEYAYEIAQGQNARVLVREHDSGEAFEAFLVSGEAKYSYMAMRTQ